MTLDRLSMFKDAPNLATFFISFSVFWSKILSQINVKLNVVQIVTIMIKRAQETIGCTTKLPTYYATKFIYLDHLHWVLGRYLHARTPPISRLSYVGFILLSDWCRWLLHPILEEAHLATFILLINSLNLVWSWKIRGWVFETFPSCGARTIKLFLL